MNTQTSHRSLWSFIEKSTTFQEITIKIGPCYSLIRKKISVGRESTTIQRDPSDSLSYSNCFSLNSTLDIKQFKQQHFLYIYDPLQFGVCNIYLIDHLKYVVRIILFILFLYLDICWNHQIRPWLWQKLSLKWVSLFGWRW